MDIVQIINELEQECASSKNFLWSKKTLVDMDKCASLIAELKAKNEALSGEKISSRRINLCHGSKGFSVS